MALDCQFFFWLRCGQVLASIRIFYLLLLLFDPEFKLYPHNYDIFDYILINWSWNSNVHTKCSTNVIDTGRQNCLEHIFPNAMWLLLCFRNINVGAEPFLSFNVYSKLNKKNDDGSVTFALEQINVYVCIWSLSHISFIFTIFIASFNWWKWLINLVSHQMGPFSSFRKEKFQSFDLIVRKVRAHIINVICPLFRRREKWRYSFGLLA